jgi:hypothetical protein
LINRKLRITDGMVDGKPGTNISSTCYTNVNMYVHTKTFHVHARLSVLPSRPPLPKLGGTYMLVPEF